MLGKRCFVLFANKSDYDLQQICSTCSIDPSQDDVQQVAAVKAEFNLTLLDCVMGAWELALERLTDRRAGGLHALVPPCAALQPPAGPAHQLAKQVLKVSARPCASSEPDAGCVPPTKCTL